MTKRIFPLLMAMAISINLAACGAPDQAGNNNTGVKQEAPAQESLQDDKTVKEVQVTLPSVFFEDSSEEDIKADSDANGFTGCAINEDGSVTYTMTADKQAEMLNALKQSIRESASEAINGEDAIESFERIEFAEDMTEVDIFVNDSYTGIETLYALSFYISGIYYQLFDGVPEEDTDVVVSFLKADTNELITRTSYREMMAATD